MTAITNTGPHTGAPALDLAAENLIAALTGAQPPTPINPEVLQGGVLQGR